MSETTEQRLRRKLDQRDRRIAGLERRIKNLEMAAASRLLDSERLVLDVERAVKHALCNVRMIPVFGIKSTEKILEVRAVDASGEQR